MHSVTVTWAASRAFERVTEALERAGCRGSGTGRQRQYTCPVPAHDDHRPSLSVTDGQARVLLYCHGPCDTDAILDALSLTAADLFDEQPDRIDRQRRRVVATYSYHDEAGELLFQKLRFEPKDFRVRRPDGHGGWTWGLAPETPRVLYRLPRLVAATPADQIWVVEGERDVHVLEQAGEIATTNYDGASKPGDRPTWRADYLPYLAGRDVLIVADRDEAGQQHASYVLRCLENIARFAWIVEAKSGNDTADHFAAGYGIGDFRWWS